MNDQILIVLTGGTIEKVYNKFDGKMSFNRSHFLRMLEQSRCTLKVKLHELMLKDSLEMTDEDRARILEKCSEAPEKKIIIVHGTDSMVKTARLLEAAAKDKAIVLFGAMIPYSVSDSDALFNFGTAVSAVQLLDQGVYITMNGKVFPSSDVVKDLERAEFKSLQS